MRFSRARAKSHAASHGRMTEVTVNDDDAVVGAAPAALPDFQSSTRQNTAFRYRDSGTFARNGWSAPAPATFSTCSVRPA